MRQSTRHKLDGRNAIVPAIRGALSDIDAAMRSLSKAQLKLKDLLEAAEHVESAKKATERTVKSATYYFPNKKRLQSSLRAASEALTKALDQAHVPVTQDEKIQAKVKRARVKDAKKNGQMKLEVR